MFLYWINPLSHINVPKMTSAKRRLFLFQWDLNVSEQMAWPCQEQEHPSSLGHWSVWTIFFVVMAEGMTTNILSETELLSYELSFLSHVYENPTNTNILTKYKAYQWCATISLIPPELWKSDISILGYWSWSQWTS